MEINTGLKVQLEDISGISSKLPVESGRLAVALPPNDIPVIVRPEPRVLRTFYASVPATTTESLISLIPRSDLVPGPVASSFGVTTMKRLRIQSVGVTVRCTSTTNIGGLVRLRLANGVVSVATAPCAALGCHTSGTVPGGGHSQSFALHFPEGLELSGAMQFGLTQLFSSTNATIDVQVIGYEYQA